MLWQTNSVVTEPKTKTESDPSAAIECQLAAGTEGEEQEGPSDAVGGQKVQSSSSTRKDGANYMRVGAAVSLNDNVSTEGLRLGPKTIGWEGSDETEEDEKVSQDEIRESQTRGGVLKGEVDVLEGSRAKVFNIVEKTEANLEMKDRVDEVVEEEEEEEEEEQNDDQEDHRGHEEVDDDEEEDVGEEKDDNGEEDDEEEEDEDDEEMHPHQLVAAEERMDGDDDEEEEAGEDDELQSRDGTLEEQAAFQKTLKQFFKERRMDYKAPKFYGEELNVLKLWRAVTSLGGYDQVTSGKLWRKVGEQFQPPKTCTTLSWSFRGFYEKALLDYERFQRGHPFTSASHPDGTISGTDSQAMSPNTPSSQGCYPDHLGFQPMESDLETFKPSSTPASGSGRARRDAATRAMHGWHARLGNGEVGDSIIKEKMGAVTNKKEKPLKNLVGGKRKETLSAVERAMKVARTKGSKSNKSLSLADVPGKPILNSQGKPSTNSKKGQKLERTKQIAKVNNNVEPALRGLKLVITDDGPPADWVKINAYRNVDGYEIYALVPGLAREEVRIQCEEGGRVVICGSPEQPNNPWGVTAFRKVVNLPSKIDAHHTSAVVTLYGQLFVRVPFAVSHTHISF